ncbi:MAG: hypothetical protein KF727_13405 [Microbacteriaceae bacterium]|nr:hypothetical protein [Microbacteriaceae bacterium]
MDAKFRRPDKREVAMTRVEWTRYVGDDVEAVVAMMVNREQPNSVRITPSRGDGGVDILDRGQGDDGGDAVHQVKRYTGPLTAKQKAEVVDSLDALLKDPRWLGLRVTTWYLVMPWDPTPELETWLHELGRERGLHAVWRGLSYVEQLAAKYPEVIDYYLHGGRDRVEEIYQNVISLMALPGGASGNGSPTDVPSVADRIAKAVGTLDVDPHYRYELRFGDGAWPDAVDRPGLVMTWMSGHAKGGPWIAVDVIARCAASVEVRPITFKGSFAAKEGSEFADTLRDFVSYGTPFTSPDDAYTGELDAPGGLGGRLEKARVTMLPRPQDLGDNVRLHVDLLDPTGSVLASADLVRVDRSNGKDGVRVVLEEAHHTFVVEDRYNLTGSTSSRNVHLGEFAGQPVLPVLRAVEFLSMCRPPNVGRVSAEHTDPEMGSTDPNWAFPPKTEMTSALDELQQILTLLAKLQKRTRTTVLVPDFDATSDPEVRKWDQAARMLEGEELSMTYPGGHALIVELPADTPTPEGTFTVQVPFVVEVGTQKLDFGTKLVTLSNATLLDSRVDDERAVYSYSTPDRVARFRWKDDSASA